MERNDASMDTEALFRTVVLNGSRDGNIVQLSRAHCDPLLLFVLPVERLSVVFHHETIGGISVSRLSPAAVINV